MQTSLKNFTPLFSARAIPVIPRLAHVDERPAGAAALSEFLKACKLANENLRHMLPEKLSKKAIICMRPQGCLTGGLHTQTGSSGSLQGPVVLCRGLFR